MKRIIILLLALMPMMAGAQEMTVDHNLKDVLYQKVSNSSISYDEALEYILAYDIIDNVVSHGNMIAGDLKPEHIDYVAEGYTRAKVPLYLSNGAFTCRLIFRFKEGRYKVEAYNMRFYEGGLGGTTYSFYDGYGPNTFDTAIGLVLKHLTEKTSLKIPAQDW